MNKLLVRALHTVPIVAMAALLSGAAVAQKLDARPLDEGEVNNLAALGAHTFGIEWGGKLAGANARGVNAVSDGVTTLTTRPGNRIFIIHNNKLYPPADDAVFKGADDELRGIGVKLLQAAGGRDDEFATVNVLQQFTQIGEVGADSKNVKVSQPAASHRSLLVTRRIKGIEVPSSRLALHVDPAGRIAFLELAWPDISAEVLNRALRLQEFAAGKFVPPKLEGATVEAVDPVILHSPAVGFYDDATAAIRVIYRPQARQVGQKAVRYLDEKGQDVVMPRDVDRPDEEPAKRAEAVK